MSGTQESDFGRVYKFNLYEHYSGDLVDSIELGSIADAEIWGKSIQRERKLQHCYIEYSLLSGDIKKIDLPRLNVDGDRR